MNKDITNILKYGEDNNAFWIYSIKGNDDNSDIFYKYYILRIKDNVPMIEDIKNPIATLQNINIQPQKILEGTIEYIKFMAIKEIADKNIIKKIRM